ncbi:MAG: hypothetical protein ACRDY0_03385 [Acidimicrobiales bacterium]
MSADDHRRKRITGGSAERTAGVTAYEAERARMLAVGDPLEGRGADGGGDAWSERSSTTREYSGAMVDVAAQREGRGEFDTEDAF